MSALAVAPRTAPYVRLPVKASKDGVFRIASKDGVARKKIRAALREEQMLVFDFTHMKDGVSMRRLHGLLRQARNFVHEHRPEGGSIVLTGFTESTSRSVERSLCHEVDLVSIDDRAFTLSAKTRTVYASSFTLLIEPWQRSDGHRDLFDQLVARDGGACVWCGCSLDADSQAATIDHVIPRSAGGVNHLDNYVLACGPCNSRRRAVDAADWMQVCLGRLHLQHCVNIIAIQDAIERAEARGRRSLIPVPDSLPDSLPDALPSADGHTVGKGA
jgi:hypothetical protein